MGHIRDKIKKVVKSLSGGRRKQGQFDWSPWMWEPGGDVEANRELRERAQRRHDDDK
jgi:hypothetical protein